LPHFEVKVDFHESPHLANEFGALCDLLHALVGDLR
jgi:hypothetical protein